MARCSDRTGERGSCSHTSILRRGYGWTIHCVRFALEAVPGSTNAEGDGSQTIPVGAAGVGVGGLFGLTVIQSVAPLHPENAG